VQEVVEEQRSISPLPSPEQQAAAVAVTAKHNVEAVDKKLVLKERSLAIVSSLLRVSAFIGVQITVEQGGGPDVAPKDGLCVLVEGVGAGWNSEKLTSYIGVCFFPFSSSSLFLKTNNALFTGSPQLRRSRHMRPAGGARDMHLRRVIPQSW
jgi:hypothetical protein